MKMKDHFDKNIKCGINNFPPAETQAKQFQHKLSIIQITKRQSIE